jgi:hypothetical protein
LRPPVKEIAPRDAVQLLDNNRVLLGFPYFDQGHHRRYAIFLHPLAEKARKDFPHSPAGKACSKTVVFSGSGDAKTVKNQ